MKQASILYVDEDPAVTRSTESILRSAGHSVMVAHNAADGILLLRLFPFDMLLLDCVPAFTWLTEEAKRIRQNLPVALCTDVPGYFQLPDVDRVLPKPLLAPSQHIKGRRGGDFVSPHLAKSGRAGDPAPVFLEKIAGLLAPSDDRSPCQRKF